MWTVNDLNRWMPPQLADRPDVLPLIRELAGGLEVHADGVQVRGVIICHNAEQASKLRINLKLLLLTGGFLLKRSDQPAAQAFAGRVGDIESYVDGSLIGMVLGLTPAELTELLDKSVSLELP